MRILFADDETSIQELMRIELPRLGYEATVCPDGRTALAALERTAYDCVIVDLDMPGVGGLEVIARVRETSPDTEAVIITGKSSLESAVTAVRQGVFDYLTKPCKLAEIQAVLERVRKKRELTARLRALESRVRRAEGSGRMVGGSAGLEQVRRLVERVAASESNVLIRGETGTGKELVARAIHEASPRADRPLVAVNCGSLPEHLVESELFGHRKGAFTGADEHRAGLFEQSDGDQKPMMQRQILTRDQHMGAIVEHDLQRHLFVIFKWRSGSHHRLGVLIRQHGQFRLIGLEQARNPDHVTRATDHGARQG